MGPPKKGGPDADNAEGHPTTTNPNRTSDLSSGSRQVSLLTAEALAIRELPATVIKASDIGTYAVEYAVNGWQVGPLCSRDRRSVYGKDPTTGLTPHGVLDFTSDVATVAKRWSRAPYNIGARVPKSMFVLDIDGPDRTPHPGRGLEALAQLEDQHGPLPPTLTQITGSGGLHMFFRRPHGKLSKTRLPAGLEYKDHGGYVVMAPSVHPDTRERYVRCDHPVAAPPQWLIDLLLPEKKPHTITPAWARSPLHGQHSGFFSGSIADSYSQSTSWSEILGPHGWSCIGNDPDGDGARWLHPTHTSSCSATIRHGCLFVYSSNTPFDVTEAGNARGYTKFKAYAVLNHDGDMSAAARALMAVA